ncbi:MAG: hypothetical protein IPK67_04870 [Planctomycetes bacterium]|nr:hypothetical protein [Planctomycetota bacterium]
MNVNDFWQENKRFVLTVAGGVALFFIGVLLIDSLFGADLADQLRRKSKSEGVLAGSLYQQADLDRLRAENRALLESHELLSKATVFVTRKDFAPSTGSLANRYFEVVARTRDEVLPAAGRAGIPVPENLGLPALAPTKDDHIERTIEALDLIERTLRLSFESGIGRVEGIEIKLDPRLLSGKPLEGLEKTLVTFKLRGNATALVRLSLLLVRSAEGRVGVLERAEFLAGGAREDDARLELVLAAARLHQASPPKEDQ